MNVVITGASKGIGKAIAASFAGEGAALFLCARNDRRLNDAAAELQQRFPECRVYVKAVDMSVKEEVKQFAAWCLEFGVPDILVNNAGEFLPGNICDEAEDNLEKMIAVNLYSAYHLTRALLPKMIAADPSTSSGRHIFNMCSIASLQAYKNGGSYSISKSALMGFSKNLREELKQQHIKVTAVYPGAVMTDSWSGYDNSNNRIMEASDIATMILAASKLTAQANVEDIIVRPLLGDL